MEPRFGQDFSGVRLHTDSEAAGASKELNAQAFTRGSDIYFGNGRYQLESTQSQHLLAHELTHVVQQSNRPSSIQKYSQTKPADKSAGKEKIGIVYKEEGVNLRDQPEPSELSNILQHLPFNTKLIIDEKYPDGWYRVRIKSSSAIGYVVGSHIKTNLPEPNAIIYKISEGTTAIGIAESFYNNEIVYGADLRFFVNVLEYINRGTGNRGIYRDNPDDSWEDVKIRSNYLIWIPSIPYTKSLFGKVGSNKFQQSQQNLIPKSATALIDRHTTLGNLAEDELGQQLFLLTWLTVDNSRFVESVLDKLDDRNRDDVSRAFMRSAKDNHLNGIASSKNGVQLLDRIHHELTSGYLSDDDEQEAFRIVAAKQRMMSIEDFTEGIENAMVFPFRLPGLTVIDDAPIMAERRSNGKIHVEMPVRVLGTKKFRAETRTLPDKLFTSGIELDPNQIVGIKLYDEGGPVVFVPALGLIGYSAKATTTTFNKMGEVAILGATLGIGGLAAGGARATTWGARALLWADRAATAIGIVTTVINEHRGWILKNMESGPALLKAVNIANSIAGIYGIGRFALEGGRAIYNLKKALRAWKNEVSTVRSLSKSKQKDVRDISDNTDKFLKNLDDIKASKVDNATPSTRGEQKSRIASGVDEDPGPLLRGGKLNPRQQSLIDRLAAADELGPGLTQVKRREVTATDLAALQRHTSHEHALVILKDNRRVLVDVGSYRGGALPPNTKTLLMHSHPHDFGTGMSRLISQEDVEALMMLNQRYSYMVTVDGTVYRFTMKTVPMTEGEVVRKFNAVLGWVKP